MRQTIVEKIFSEHCGKRVKAGEVVISPVDLCFGQDESGCLIIENFKKMLTDDVFDKNRFAFVLDHGSPSPSIAFSAAHDKIRSFARAHGGHFFDVGSGICHQVIPEAGAVTCGDLVIGADTHACTLGAINCVGIEVGELDAAIALASGKCWFRVPDTVKAEIDGALPKGVYAKDVALFVISDMAVPADDYRAVEFCGDAIGPMTMDARFTLANLAAEMGAKCAVLKADRKTIDWAKRYCARAPKPIESDPDAKYADERHYDISDLSPQVAMPHSPRNVCPAEKLKGTRVDTVFIGTCANGRLEDMEIAARVLKGNKTAKGLKLIVTPASKKIYLDMIKKGIVEILIDAGAIVNNPGCGPCSGDHQGVLADSEVVLSTSNRNDKGRMGNPDSEIYLASPATAAATAIAGKISDSREYKRKL